MHDLEKKAKILGFDKQPYTQQDAVKDAAIFGMTDARLREKALAEDPTLDTLTRWGHAREAGKEDAVNLKDASSGAIKRIGWREHNPAEEMDDEELDNLIDSLNVMKLKKAGKYSVRFKNKDSSSCNRCLTDHPQGRCPAFGKECFTCGEKNHFSRAAICKGKSVKRITEDTETKPYSDTRMKTNTSHLNNERPTEATRKIKTIKKIREPSTNDLWVPIKAGKETIQMFIDSGCDYTIIPPEYYNRSMGELIEPDINLRAWGATELLQTKGMIRTKLTTAKGAKKTAQVYIVDGFHPEPLLGSSDAVDLGFLVINKEGRSPTQEEYRSIKALIPQKIRDELEKNVITHPEETNPIPDTEIEKVMKTVEEFKGVVFDNERIGKIETAPIHLEYDPEFKPEQPRFRIYQYTTNWK